MDKIYKSLFAFICVSFIFIIGVAVGARLVFEGVIQAPGYCYEKMKNDIYRIEVFLDNGESYYFYKNEDEDNNIDE